MALSYFFCFRLTKLLTSKVEAEKTTDSKKEIDQLRKRLRELEDEKDLITHQRNVFVKLKSDANVHDGIKSGHHRRFMKQNATSTSTHLRSLGSLIDASSDRKQLHIPRNLTMESERMCRDVVYVQTNLPPDHDIASPHVQKPQNGPPVLTRSDLSHHGSSDSFCSLRRKSFTNGMEDSIDSTSGNRCNSLNKTPNIDLLRTRPMRKRHEWNSAIKGVSVDGPANPTHRNDSNNIREQDGHDDDPSQSQETRNIRNQVSVGKRFFFIIGIVIDHYLTGKLSSYRNIKL